MRMFKFFNGLQGGFALALEKNKVGLLFSILLYLFRLLIKPYGSFLIVLL